MVFVSEHRVYTPHWYTLLILAGKVMIDKSSGKPK